MEEIKTKYELYLERYCKNHNLSKDEADEHAIVKEVKKQYMDEGEN